MTLDAKTLYQDTLTDHGKNPRNEGALLGFTHEATLHNPLCGDRVTVRLIVDGDRMSAVKFEARGCMIARASASLMTEVVKDHTTNEARRLAEKLEAMVNAKDAPQNLGALAMLEGVREFPARKACVLLAWQALALAIDQSSIERPGAATD